MVLADSHEISRVPHYSGTYPTYACNSPSTRLSRTPVRYPTRFNYHHTRKPLPGREETNKPHNTAHATPAEYHTHTV
ncbi:hypothetical protein HMPREF9241_00002 [Schaalia turicensis ACS-279-V-Col4]|uniref:Uncharacterized protein n=1 Tax=Schaalia turicensis ACS-279-V-Col4 TaxID=883077 RepID=K0YZ87_9ACTO|nr:hypothetical protein HMPREF9241_01604 [Schaalia turicensis ACS-279-V-Col4]EJZ85353.1 hypothetical protein HMPREF9241_01353 [Schaalia turicensis ACS-279-V-Col4]EJZ88480.1 hypothetical protein HMPREF9241_00002 [Schaalia turicensis ACS-279-V-Col4]